MNTVNGNQNLNWNELVALSQSRNLVTVEISGINRNRSNQVAGLDITLAGHKAFLPVSELNPGERPSKMKGALEVVVLKAEERPSGNRIVVSRKEAAKQALSGDVSALAVGQVVSAQVTQVSKHGAVVKVETSGTSVRGFIPRSFIDNRERFAAPNAVLKMGATVNCEVHEIDQERSTVILNYSRAQMRDFFGSINMGSTLEGTIRRQADFGFFVNVGPVDGLLHVSQIPDGTSLKVGDKVSAQVRSFDAEKGQVGLTMVPQIERRRRVVPSMGRRFERNTAARSWNMPSPKPAKVNVKASENTGRKPGVLTSFAELAEVWQAKHGADPVASVG